MNITNIMLKLWVLLHLGLLNVSQGSQINEVNKNVTSEFKVIQIKPTKLTRVMEGRDVIFSCVSNKPYKLCTFENHRAVKSKCSIEPVIGQKRINFQNCSSIQNRIEKVDNFNEYNCTIKLKNIEGEDAGKWTCKLESQESMEHASGVINIEIFFELKEEHQKMILYLVSQYFFNDEYQAIYIIKLLF